MAFRIFRITSVAISILFSVLISRTVQAKSIVLIGGNIQNVESGNTDSIAIYQRIIELAGGAENSKVGILTTAAVSREKAQVKAESYANDFHALGVSDVKWIPLHIENCASYKNDQTIANLIKTRTIFFFGGGLTSHALECFFDPKYDGTYTDSLALKTIRHRHENGAVIAGNSAGAMIQTNAPVLSGGESYQALMFGALESDARLLQNIQFPSLERWTLWMAMRLEYRPEGGLGFFPYGPIDTHFSERGRQGSLIRFASDLGQPLSFGIDENTALVVTNVDTPRAKINVVGQGGISILNLRQSKVDTMNNYWSIFDIKMSYLTQGDSFNVQDSSIQFSDYKEPLVIDGQPKDIIISTNIFSSWEPYIRILLNLNNVNNPMLFPELNQSDRPNKREFINTAFSLFKSSRSVAFGQSFETTPATYVVTFTEDISMGSQGFLGRNNLGEEVISFRDLIIDIIPDMSD